MSSFRLSWLTNSALNYEPKCGERGGIAGSQLMSTAVHMEPMGTSHKMDRNFTDMHG